MSLRVRVVALIALVLFVSLLLSCLVSGVQARHVLRAELDAALGGAAQTVKSAYEDLPHSDHQMRDLHQLVSTFDGNRHVQAILRDPRGRSLQQSRSGAPRAQAPPWFQRLLGSELKSVALAAPRGTPDDLAIVLTPTAAVDLGDAWEQFCAVGIVLGACAATGLCLVAVVIGAAFRPLVALSLEFERIGTGDYNAKVQERGPSELLRLQRGFNRMAQQLAGTTDRNRHLTHQLLTIQDEERADIARDLHDEIGPHLFAVNMDAEMIIQLHEAGLNDAVPDQVRAIQTAVSHMQRQVRDLLGRLRPTRVTELGLNAAVRDLIGFWVVRRPDISFDLDLNEDDDLPSEAAKEAAYRVVQEAANNAVRHANPKSIHVRLNVENTGELLVVVRDDGEGAVGRRQSGGLGLIGMRERVTQLGGSVVFGRIVGGVGWSVAARLPLDQPLFNATFRPAPLVTVDRGPGSGPKGVTAMVGGKGEKILVDGGGDPRELAAEGGAKRAHGADNDHSDQGGDQSIFDRRRARVVFEKPNQNVGHGVISRPGPPLCSDSL